ncbi:MAG: HIT family protein [Sphingobium sp.]|jgi:diadenosine tetraphosphate (Ap4A) HIT family hydrolase|nr:HIT family protein [Sphingobium sp.]MCI1271999.1 HIT family protein [Sphingobium sp.]MCI1755962.1 HIT family protein [Sphingobium sp.]MCI2054115.1 HIT family protein [Sphingobium sp.]
MNETIRKFGYPCTLVGETAHWLILLRPAQVTLGSLVVAAKSDATAFGTLPAEYHADLAEVTRRVEAMLGKAADYDRINWLMLMMVDPQVHFHVLPRYDGARSHGDLTVGDAGWPGPPDLKSAVTLSDEARADLVGWLAGLWPATA